MTRDDLSSSSSTFPPTSPTSTEEGACDKRITGVAGFRGRNIITGRQPLPQPVIHCDTLTELANANFVNIVFESETNCGGESLSRDNQVRTVFRVSDENNKDVCRILESVNPTTQLAKKGVKYLECLDPHGNCVLLIAYPVGLGEVALLSPQEELAGECQSNVEFICLSVKVKYNFYDVNGNRLMKMTAIMPEPEDGAKFVVIVKRSKNQKLALIKMGSLKTCCNIRFKANETNSLERLQIVALWVGFMHYELKDVEVPLLLERHLAVQQQKKESQENKTTLTETSIISQASMTHEEDSLNEVTVTSADNPSEESTSSKSRSKEGVSKVKQLKKLVKVHFSRRHQPHREHNNNLNDAENFTEKHKNLTSNNHETQKTSL